LGIMSLGTHGKDCLQIIISLKEGYGLWCCFLLLQVQGLLKEDEIKQNIFRIGFGYDFD